MLAEPIIQASRHGGYVLDGFPRNLRQAEAAYNLTEQVGGIELEAVIHLEVAREELTRRLLARAGRKVAVMTPRMSSRTASRSIRSRPSRS